MKIIEGIKRVRTIEKEIQRQSGQITEYSSKLSNEKTIFSTDDAQKKAIIALIQSNTDLCKEAIRLKRLIDLTNNSIKVSISIGTSIFTDTLAGHLHMKRKYGALMIQTYRALNSTIADMKISRVTVNKENPVIVERMYDEVFKNNNLKELHTYLSEFDQQLEVINATTDLVEA